MNDEIPVTRRFNLLLYLAVILLTQNPGWGQPYPASYYELSHDGGTLLFWKGDLEEVNLATDPVLGKIRRIAPYAFANRDSLGRPSSDYRLRELILPPSLKSIGYMAFWCKNLQEIRLNEGIEVIEESAFCETPLKSLHLPASLMQVEGAFFRCYDLEFITVAEESLYYSVEEEVLISLKDLAVVRYPSGSLRHRLLLPEGVKVLAYRSVSDSRYLSIAKLPEGIETIEDEAFLNCPSLVIADLPSTLKSLAGSAFESSPIDTLLFQSSFPPQIEGKLRTHMATARVLAVPENAMDTYAACKPLEGFAEHLFTLREINSLNEENVEGHTLQRSLPYEIIAQTIVLELPQDITEARLFDREGEVKALYRHSGSYPIESGVYMLLIGDQSYKVVVPDYPY